MITSIKGCAKKLIKSNKFIMISSIFSIVISVALIINMSMFFSNAEKSMRDNLKTLYGEMDLSVGVPSMYDNNLDKATVQRISSIKEIKEISPVIIGELEIKDKVNFKPYSVGVDNSSLCKSKYKYKKNISENQVVINKVLKENMNLNIGDLITIEGRSFKIIEVIDNSGQIANIPDMVYINLNTFKDIIKDNGEATFLLIKLSDENKNIEVAEKIKNIYYSFISISYNYVFSFYII